MDIVQVNQAEMLSAINKSEVDIQVATAKSYPRDVEQSLSRIRQLATIDDETAENCFYAMRRGNDIIEGPSVRLAEIIGCAWGNLRVQARIIGNDGKFITAQGIAHDLENNFAASVEVKRRITDKYGKTFSDDMQVVTGNAAASIAFRNALMKVVPSAVTHRIVAEIRQVAKGKALSLEQRVANMLKWFEGVGVTRQQVLAHIGVAAADKITEDKADYLRGLAVAIKEGSTTVKETFGEGARTQSEAQAAAATKAVEEAQRKAAEAMAAATGGKGKGRKSGEGAQAEAQAPEAPAGKVEKVDTETGEVTEETAEAQHTGSDNVKNA